MVFLPNTILGDIGRLFIVMFFCTFYYFCHFFLNSNKTKLVWQLPDLKSDIAIAALFIVVCVYIPPFILALFLFSY